MAQSILSKKSKEFQQKVKEAPKLPGCYIYFDENDEVLYVGKAKILKNRVSSYFNNYYKLPVKIQQMIFTAKDIKTYTVDSEFEALVLESNLIKKYRPKYNTMMKDDKSYIYVRFERIRKSNQPIPTKDSVYQDFPRITITRQKKNDGALYFGPYPDSTPIKRILKRLRKIFPFRTSTHLVYQESSDPLIIKTQDSRPCFYYHIGLCEGACEGLETKEHYVAKYKNLIRFFKGEKLEILHELEREMQGYVKTLEYEKAAKVRDKINDIKYVTTAINISNTDDDLIIESKKKEQKEAGILELVEKLGFPPEKLSVHKGFRIECYDISNIQGTNSTGSMVVSIDGAPEPSLYRRFKIRSKSTPDDFTMLKEVLGRRFAQYLKSKYELEKENLPNIGELQKKVKTWKIDESFSQKPDLLIIDGGKGQLSSVYEIMKLFGLENEIPVVGLAKRDEEIFKIRGQFKIEGIGTFDNKFERVLLPRRSEPLFIVQRIRDEAHRFAKNYHKLLRNKNLIVK